MTSALLQVLRDYKNYKILNGEKSSKKKWKDIINNIDPSATDYSPSQLHTKLSSWKPCKIDNINSPSKLHSYKHYCYSLLLLLSTSNSNNESRLINIQEVIRPSNKDLAKTSEILAAFKSNLFININFSQLGTFKVKLYYHEALNNHQSCTSPSK